MVYRNVFVVLCFVLIIFSFLVELFVDMHQGYFTGTGAIVWLPQRQRRSPAEYGWCQSGNSQGKTWQSPKCVEIIWCVLHFSSMGDAYYSRKVHYNDIMWASCRIKAPATRRFLQQIIQAKLKEIIKSRIAGPLWRNPSVTDLWSPSLRANDAENVSVSWRHRALYY